MKLNIFVEFEKNKYNCLSFREQYFKQCEFHTFV